MKKLILILIINLAIVSVPIARAANTKPWSILLYRGVTATQTFGNLILGKYNSFGEDIYTAELAYTLDQKNIITRFFSPLLDTVQFATNYTWRHDYKHSDNVNEGDLYIIWRWTRWPNIISGAEFPWQKYVVTTIGLGEGFSYASHPPYADQIVGLPETDFNRLLNYLMLEITFAMPSHPEWQLVGRLHHRCTMWGVYPKNRSAGSTSAGIGIRYYF